MPAAESRLSTLLEKVMDLVGEPLAFGQQAMEG
jgi:hypothetical protein